MASSGWDIRFPTSSANLASEVMFNFAEGSRKG
jgi:hypothetical protein